MKILKPILIILALFLYGCSVSQFAVVKVSYNPKLSFKPDSNTILLINQFDYTKLQANDPKDLNVLKTGVFTAIKYAEVHLKQLPNVKVINIVDSATLSMNTDSIKPLALKYHSDYVLALNDFSAAVDLTGLKAIDPQYYSINANVNFTLYESNGIFYKKLNGIADDHQDEGEGMALAADMISRPNIKGNKGAVLTAIEHAAQDALKDYLIFSVTHKRPLYNDAWLQPAVKEILAGNFNKADSLLQPFLKNTNMQVIAKAAYNLAVVYEAEGDIDMAIEVAQLSLDKFNNEYAAAILADLKEE
jgi:tetratricopeptide (TPR) repeat protein